MASDCQCKDMAPVDIKVAMLKAGVTQSDIARQLGKSVSSVHLVIHGRMVSDPIRRAIADAIGMDVKRIWPSTYLYGVPRGAGRPAQCQ